MKIYNEIVKTEAILIYKHLFSFFEINQMSYFDLKLYIKLIENVIEEERAAQENTEEQYV